MLVYLVLLHRQYYTPTPVCQSTWYFYIYNTIHQYMYVCLPGITTHTILYTNTFMLVYLVWLHIQYYAPIPVCQSTWYYYTYNTMHQYLYVILHGIITHRILCTNTCMLVYLVLIHIQYYTPIPVYQSTWYYYTYNTIHQYLYVSLPGITTHTIQYTNTCMLVYVVLLHIQYYTPAPVCQSTWYYYTYNIMHQYLYVSLPSITTHTILYTNTCMFVYLELIHKQYYTPIPVCQSTQYYYTYNTIHKYLYVSLPGITTHTILCTNTCMLVYLVLLHIQYYAPIPVCYSTWYYYTQNYMHQYLYVSLPGINTHTIVCTNICMLVYLVLLHIQYYTPIPVYQSTWYYYTYNTIHQYLYVSLPGITTHTIQYTNTCMLVYLVLLHIQYYTPIPVCQSTWYYYTYNTIHQYLYVSLPGITTHTILYSNTCMLVYLVLLHIQYYAQIPVYQSTWYKYTYNNILQSLYVSLPGIIIPSILYTNTCILIYLVFYT